MTTYQQLATSYAAQLGLNPAIFTAQIQQESGFNPNAVSSAGAIGIAQFMPATAAGLNPPLNPRDPVASLKAAAQYDANNLQTYNGDYAKMLAAYNAGNGAVNTAVAAHGSNWLSYMPTETQNYVKAIMANQTAGTGAVPTASTSATGTSTGASGLTGLLQQWGEYVAIFLIAIVLIIIGVMLLAGKQVAGAVEMAVKP